MTFRNSKIKVQSSKETQSLKPKSWSGAIFFIVGGLNGSVGNSKFKVQSSKEVQNSKPKSARYVVRDTHGNSELKIQNLKELQNLKPEAANYVVRDLNACKPIILREEDAGKPWELEERTAIFGERIVRFSRKIPRDPTNNRLIGQLVGAGTSVGANYCEASQSVSGKDFKCTIGRCAKEAKEARYFLRMIAASEPTLADEARPLYREAHELLCIFASMQKK